MKSVGGRIVGGLARLTASCPWTVYVLAAAMVAAVLMLRFAMGFAVGDAPMLVLFVAPIILSAYIGGLGPGLTATVLAALASDYFLLAPSHSLRIAKPDNLDQWAAMCATGVLVSLLSEGLRRSRRRLEAGVQDLLKAQESMRERDEELTAIYDNAPLVMLLVDGERRVRKVNKLTEQFAASNEGELAGRRAGEALRCLYSLESPQGCGSGPHCPQCRVRATVADTFETGCSHHQVEATLPFTVDGERVTLTFLLSTARLDIRGQGLVLVTIQDITDRKRSQEALQASEERYRNLFESMDEGFALCEMIYDEAGKPVDFRYIEVNPAFARLTGLPVEKTVGRRVTELIPGIERFWIESYGRIAASGVSERFDNPLAVMGKHYEVFAWKAGEGRFAAVFTDITKRKHDEETLRKAAEELRRSNEDLSQFAYVSSHDLQEPLRMVTAFMQLFEKKYQGKLDAQGEQYVRFAVDGARRMQLLINDLLTYSRVQSRGREFAAVDSRAMLRDALSNLQQSIAESGAQITVGDLLMVHADGWQLIQVFQNLVSNAIKFCREKPPQIHVDSCRDGKNVVFSVRDNGIGIAPEFQERIFVIFQRLHVKDEYPGTGIGLAICKRIVERHGGRIWVDSAPGRGSTFHFTLAAQGEP